ncbi:hypothetical protein ACHAXT_007587 [Thalassiosira profunda]
MGGKYSRPCGASADAKELEYISALHQTGRTKLRRDGSIRAIDISRFLESRYGIQATEAEVRERILGAFGNCAGRQGNLDPESSPVDTFREDPSDDGSNSPSDASSSGGDDDGECIGGREDCLDLTQILALLLVPLLLKAERSLSEENPGRVELHSIPVSPSPNDSNENEAPKTASAWGADSTRNGLQRSLPCFATHRHRERGGKRWPDGDLIDNVFRTMMHDATGDARPRPLTKELIRQLLEFYGEGELAEDEKLLDEMLLAAASDKDELDVEGDAVLFDHRAFVRPLTHDVQQYNIDSETSLTTNYYDVFGTCYSTKERQKRKSLHRLINPVKTVEVGGDGVGVRPVRRVYTLPSVDYFADTFRSKGFVVLLWTTWILTYFSYLFGGSEVLSITQLGCDSTQFGCAVLQGITNWLTIMAQLSILGTAFVVWASVGNSVYPTNVLWVFVGMGATVLFVLLPYFMDIEVGVVSTEKTGNVADRLLYRLSVTGGFLLLVSALLNVCQRTLPKRAFDKIHMARFFTPGVIRREAEIKQAASCKVNRIVRNACEVHKVAELDGGNVRGMGETIYGRALLAYARTSDQTEEMGGFLQTWRKIWDRSLFEEEGMWFTTHLLAGNLAQFTICFFLGALFVAFYNSDLFQQGLDYLDQLDQVTDGSQRWRLMMPLIFGVVWGEVTILIIAANYIPSTVNTVLRYRSGAIDSLHSNRFLKLRFAVDHSSLLFGSIFWGTLYTAIISRFMTLLLWGVILWPDFAQVILVLFANVIGIIITMLLKWIALIGFRRKCARAYYRRSVALTNLVGVILESWNLGLTTSYMIFRSIKLLAAATLFIGRVDVPFLSDHACFVGPLELDAYPLMFRKDLLSHEAHRHPYLERLGLMYMMKLRHDDFGNKAGSCWRLLFVYALCPWMRKYRNRNDSVSDFKFAANRLWTGRMPADATAPAEKEELRSSHNNSEESDAVKALKQQNERLRRENEMMRALLVQSNPKQTAHNSCPPNLVGAATLESFYDCIEGI